MEDEPRPKVDFVDKHHNCDKEFEEYSDYDCDLGPWTWVTWKESVAVEFCCKGSLAR